MNRYSYKTIIISDLHLGTSGSKAEEVVEFLTQFSCELLILNGDIIDGWQLRKKGIWHKKHTNFFRKILKIIGKNKTKVIYLRGNHDDFLDQVIPINIGHGFRIQRDFILESNKKKYFVTHGDIFDSITSNMKWLAYLGDFGYTILLSINKLYNQNRIRRGLPYFSLSQLIKQKVKMAVSYVSDFEVKLSELAIAKNCDGIICGHIHQPAIKLINGITYMNSGDWVETLSALVENHAGEWEIKYHNPIPFLNKIENILNQPIDN
ncbi:MAG: UDP-2,3-diacylglucosamine diphosphatase [Bacteroidota bacterium]